VNQQQQEIKVSDSENGEPKIPFWRVMISVIQASFGVQNHNNRERDFTKGSFMPFVVAALLFTAVFIGVLLVIVNTVLSNA
jgi:hypothetical protein